MICARRAVSILAFFAVFAAILMTSAPRASAEPEAILSLDGCEANSFADDDLVFEDRIIGTSLGFTVNLGDGETDDDVTISENGAVSFRFGLTYDQIYGSLSELADGDNEVIAPLWADSDLTAGGSITYGQTMYQGRDAFCVNWTDVVPRIEKEIPPGFDPANPPTNTFQLLIIERSDRAAGDFDIMYNYADVEWDDSDEPCNFFFDEVGVQAVIAAEAPSAVNNDCCLDFEEVFCCPPEDIECCIEFDFEAPGCELIPQAAEAQPVFPDGIAGLAGYAFPTLTDPVVLALPGSGVVDGMVGPNGLAQKSTNSTVPGRHIFSIEAGTFPQGSLLSGVVTDSDTDALLEGARVTFCTTDNRCVGTVSGAGGIYEIPGVPDATDHTLWASGPSSGNYRSQTLDISVAGDTVVDVALVGPQPPVPGIGITPSRNGNTGTPSVYYGAPFEITAEGCANGTATYEISGRNVNPTLSGPMTYDTAAALYRATVPELRPSHGDADVTIEITCPDGADPELYAFPIYIDPAGQVFDDYSGELIEGATVTLYTAELEVGPYVMVEDGDTSIMDPAINDSNPTVTLADGRFRWDTTTGWYYVEAEKDGCEQVVAAEDGDPASRSRNVFVPPEVTDLELYLDCNNPPEVESGAEYVIEANTLGGWTGDLADFEPGVFDDDDNVVEVTSDGVLPLPVGSTVLTWTAIDDDGEVGEGTVTVAVVDVVAPVISADDVDVTVASAPVAVTFSPTATDAIDGDVAVTCDPASGSMFDAGATVVTCTATDASGNGAEATLTVDVTVDDTPPDCGGLIQEAETGDLSGTMGAAAGGNAVGAVGEPNNYTFDPANAAEYCVNIVDGGLYKISALVSALAVDADSFWVSIDDGEPALWHIENTVGFQSREVNAAGVPSAMPKLWDLAPGEHTVRFFVREGDTLLDAFELERVGNSPSGPPPECGGLAQEAEDGALAGSMVVASSDEASGGFYVVAPAGSGRFYTILPADDYVEFCFTVDAPGDYYLEAITRAPDFRRDSFFVQVGDQPESAFVWHVNKSGIFKTGTVNDESTPAANRPTTYSLEAGEHTVRFYQREEQTRLDRIELVAVQPG